MYDNNTWYNHTAGLLNDSGKPWYRISIEDDNYTLDGEWSVKFEHNKEKEEITIWLPVILLSVVLFLYNIGLGSVPYVLISELFSVNVSIFILPLNTFIIHLQDDYISYSFKDFTIYLLTPVSIS